MKSYLSHKNLMLGIVCSCLSGCAMLWNAPLGGGAEGWYRSRGFNTLDDNTKSYLLLESNVVWIVDVTDWGNIQGFAAGHYQMAPNMRMHVHLSYVDQQEDQFVGKVCSQGIRWHDAYPDRLSKRVDIPFPEGVFPRVYLSMPMSIWTLYGVTNETQNPEDSRYVPYLMKQRRLTGE